MSEYREGDDEVLRTQEEDDATKKAEKPIETAFIVIVYEDGAVDIATKLPQVKMKRTANYKDMRNASRQLYDDMSLIMISQATSNMVQKGLADYAAIAMERDTYNKVVSDLKNPAPGNFLLKKG